MIVVRYADDFIVGFQDRAEAEKFLTALRERFAKFGLELHPDKTRLIEFGPYAAQRRQRRGLGRPETFNFLGLTHACDTKRSNGRFTVLRQTMRKRLQAKLAEVKVELRRRMHDPVPEVGKWLGMVVAGHCRYYGVPMNSPALGAVPIPGGLALATRPVAPQPTRSFHLGSHDPPDHSIYPTCTHPSSVSFTKVWCHPLGKSRMR